MPDMFSEISTGRENSGGAEIKLVIIVAKVQSQ